MFDHHYQFIMSNEKIEPENCFNTMNCEEDAAMKAAFVLVSMRHAKLDEDTARNLQAMKKAFCPKFKTTARPQHQARNPILSQATSRALPKHQAHKSPLSPATSQALPNFPPFPYIDNLPKFGYCFDGTELTRFPPMENLRNCIRDCSEPFEKQITSSDVNPGQSRITLNKSFVQTYFLPLLYRNENVDSGIPVVVYGPDGMAFEMTFRFWSAKNYVLNNGWNEFVKRYGLKACTYWATIWMFRHKQLNSLCFAMSLKVNMETTQLIPSRKRGKAPKSSMVEDKD